MSRYYDCRSKQDQLRYLHAQVLELLARLYHIRKSMPESILCDSLEEILRAKAIINSVLSKAYNDLSEVRDVKS